MHSPLQYISRAAENAALCVKIRLFRLPKPRLDQATALLVFNAAPLQEGGQLLSLSLSLSEKTQLAAPREGNVDDHGAGGTGPTTLRARSLLARRALDHSSLTALLVGEGVRR